MPTRRQLLASILGLLAVAACQPPEAAPVVGRRPPDFQLTSLDGELISPGSFAGKPLIVNFFATWCVPCRIELPAFQALTARHPDLRVLLIDLQEDPGDVAEFLDSLRVSLPTVVDETGHVTKAYRVRGLPSTFFLDRDGIIRAIQLGAVDDRTLEGGVARIL